MHLDRMKSADDALSVMPVVLRYDDGYHNIINVDNSEVVISQMMERNFKRQLCLPYNWQ